MRLTFSHIATENLRIPDMNITFTPGMNFLQFPNGTGKTTLLQLVRHALSNDWELKDPQYINSFKKKGSDIDDGIFELGFEFKKEKYIIRANFNFLDGTVGVDTDTPNGRKRDNFAVPRELKPFLTKHHVDIFIFSAQMANTHFQKDSASVTNAVGTFSGRLNLEKLLRSLEKKFKAKHRGVTQEGTSTRLEKKLDALEKKINELTDKKKAYDDDLEPIQNLHNELQQKINSNQAQQDLFRNNKDKIEGELRGVTKEIVDRENIIEKLAASPMNISPKFENMVNDVYTNLEKAKLPGVANLFFDEISEQPECICGTPMTNDLKKEILSRKKNYLDTDDVGFINEMKANIKNATEDLNRENFYQQIELGKEAWKKQEDLNDDISELNEDLKNSSLTPREIKKYDELGDEIDRIGRALEAITKSKYEGDNNHIRRNQEIGNLSEMQIESLIENLPDAEWLQSKLSEQHADASGYLKANSNMQALKSLVENSIESAELKIKEEIAHSMNGMISSIHTDQDFKVTSIDDRIYLDGQEGGSGAQEVITVSAFALSLLSRSQVDFPMLIDHPVKDIQNEDRAQLSKFLSDTSHQCICLVINSEKDGFTRDEDTRERHEFLNEANFITAVRKKNAPDFPQGSKDSSDACWTYDYEFFNNFKTAKYSEKAYESEEVNEF